jgi:transaldolase
MNPLLRLRQFGQSVWLDDIDRTLVSSGTLARLIAEDGLAGITSNPTIFRHAIADSDQYADAIRRLKASATAPEGIAERLMVEDIAAAADLFRPQFEASGGRDGYVSIEISPHLARDTAATVAEARRLREAIARPNLLIKVPGSVEGLASIRELIAEGISVNVTLLFSVTRYGEVADAYLSGLEARRHRGEPIGSITSVASFFLSRIDTAVDRLLDRAGPAAETLRGEAAIASAKLAYAHYEETIGSQRWRALAEAGATPQRLLWASTGTKDRRYTDTRYVEALIGPDTITTLPRETLDAYRDHGHPEVRLRDGRDAAKRLPDRLAAFDIDLEAIAGQLEADGIDKFMSAWDGLLSALRASP